ncbi:transmembrane protein [Nitzschia inconspicua]|uniref:Transmembrane protein n=1 Tax=Nitzschia inconspicua TaxID=303405 RepID=A0A9K3LJ84_9STRA|nr:transmembrane protein [Nitzschia inconspicua]
MAEQFFNRIAEDVLKATEQIQSRFEEGWSVLSTGELPKASQKPNEFADSTAEQLHQQAIDYDDLDLEGLSEEEIRELLDTQEDLMQHSPLKGIADGVMGNIMAGNVGPQTPMEHFHAFRSAITWSEKFILGLLAFHIAMFSLCLYVSRRDGALGPRVFVLVLIGVIVRSAEYLNSWGAQHWEEFATQDYFDKRGVFVGIMISGPLLLDSLIMLFLFLSEAGSLLVQVKKEELKRKKKGKEKQKDVRSKLQKQD